MPDGLEEDAKARLFKLVSSGEHSVPPVEIDHQLNAKVLRKRTRQANTPAGPVSMV